MNLNTNGTNPCDDCRNPHHTKSGPGRRHKQEGKRLMPKLMRSLLSRHAHALSDFMKGKSPLGNRKGA